MRINHNISALKANNQLSRTNKMLDASLKKLSSGLRINNAADDAAGLAISEKMRTQIAGLNQASRNASDGISVIQTAEGALIEVEAMLQRMRELSVQSANGTYTLEDRAAIQAEINQLNEEIQRISDTTEFNNMTLLDGNIDRRSYSNNNNVKLVSLSDTVAVGNYELEITQDARQAVIVGNKTDLDMSPELREIADNEAGTININGQEVKVKAGDTVEDVFQKLRDVCDSVDVNVFAVKYVDENGDPGHPKPSTTNYKENAGYENKALENGDALVFVSKEYGSDQKIEIFCDNPNLCEILGLTKESAKAVGVDAKAALIPKDATNSSQFENTATLSAKGNKITISDRNDFKMVFEVEPGIVQTTFEDVKITAYDGAPTSPSVGAVNPNDYVEVAVSVLDAGPMDLQIGANEGQVMSIRIPKVNPATLGIDKINLSTPEGAQEAIQLLDIAINEVSAIRSKLGAYQNRLEHSISNLNVTAENMTESLSRIADVDMALEMANYTQQNVLSQTGTAMLAQANQRPQSILTLLQQ
ncbi:MAG: flagellar biosynthesis protein FlgL [Clostridiales bacterium]|nr:flagellar biosynthesis protein FlgL [Clostridiales bacterium]